MFRRKVLRSSAFQEETPLLDEDTKGSLISEKIYNDDEPFYHYKNKKFQSQCNLLFEKLTTSCRQLNIEIPKDDKGDYLDQFNKRHITEVFF